MEKGLLNDVNVYLLFHDKDSSKNRGKREKESENGFLKLMCYLTDTIF